MSDVLYWIVVSALAIGTAWLITGQNGVIFISIVCILGGIFLYVENKIHPHIK